MDCTEFEDLLTGCFKPSSLQDKPSKVIRVFLTCTATDTIEERSALIERVYPKLREYCRQKYGLEFQVLDPRWGSTEDWHDWHSDRELCLREVIECKRLSAGPNFVCLIGQRYGTRAVPVSVPATDFQTIREALRCHRNRETRDAALLDLWYRKDTNVVPPAYRLIPMEEGRENQQSYYEKHSLILGKKRLEFDWEETRLCLRRLFTKGVEYCLAEGSLTDDVGQWYLSSDLEKEVDLGLLHSFDPPSNCHVFVRDIVDLKNYIGHKEAPKFIELQYNEFEEKLEIDNDSNNRLIGLKKHKIPAVLPEENIHPFSVLWRYETGVETSLHSEYIDDLVTRFEVNMVDLIDKFARQRVEILLPPIIEEITQHWLVARDRSRNFIGREEVLEVIQSYIGSNDNKPLVLYGEAGSGKTSTIAKAASKVYGWLEDGCVTVVRFIGSTAESFDTRQILYTICLQIAIVLGQERDAVPNEYKELQQYFFEMLSNFPEDKNLVIFLDSLHILVPQYNAHYLHWIPKILQENVKIIVSTLPETHNLLQRLKYEIIQSENNFIELPPLHQSECVQLLQHRLEQEHRCLHTDQEAVICEAFRECSYPLYVELMLTEVRHWKSTTDPPQLPANMKEFIHHIFDKLELKHGKILACRAAAYLTASTTGVSDCEMEDLLSLDDDVVNEVFNNTEPRIRRLPSIYWMRLKKDIRDFLHEKESEGVTVSFWSHRMFVDIVKSRYLADEDSRKQIHSALADYNLGIWHGQSKPYKLRPCSANAKDIEGTANRFVPSQPLTFMGDGGVTRYNKRKYEQVPRHLYLSGRLKELNSLVLFSYGFLYNKTKALSLEHILADFVLNPGVEATLVERALRDAQPFMEINIDNMAAEITGRLLCYYTTHPNIRQLLQECDTAGLTQCALIPNFPYHQVPGSPLRYTIECQNTPSQFGLFGEESRYILTKDPSESAVHVFDLATGEPRTKVETSIGDMHITPNGVYAVIVDHVSKKSIKVHTTEDGRFLGQLLPTGFLNLKPEDTFKLSKLSITDAFICFTVATSKSYLCIADLEFCKFAEHVELPGKNTVCEVTPDSRYVFCNAAETLLAYDLCTMEKTTSTQLTFRPTRLVFTADGSKGFHINNTERKVYGMVIKDGNVELVFKIPVENSFADGDTVKDLTVSNNQDMLLIIGNSNLLVYQISSEKISAHFTRPTDIPAEFKLPRSHYRNISFTNANFSPDDKFVMATIFRNVYIWNIANNRLLTTLQAPVGIITEMLIPTDRGQVVTHLDGSNLIHVWSLGDAIGHVGMLDRLTSPIQRMVFTADSRIGFIGCYDSDEIGVLDMKNGQLIDLLTHESKVVDFNVTSDGEYAMVSVQDAKQGTYNKIWHITGRRVIYEYGNVPAINLPLQEENTVITITQDESKFKEPYRISQMKFKDGTFEEYQFDQTLPFILSKPFITPEDKYLVVLSADEYDEAHAHYINPTICSVSLKTNADIARYSARELRDIVRMRRILHIRPYANNSYTVIVLFTNEPDIMDPDDGRKSRGYDYSFGFMIYDIAAGVVCQVIENFMPPQTPMEELLFTSDVRLCIDNQSNVFDMATGYFKKRLVDKDVRPRLLALNDKILLYFDRCYLFALRVADGKYIGHVHVHGQISCIALCHDMRTVVVGCEDGSLVSYVIIDNTSEDPRQVLPTLYSRQAKLVTQRSQSAKVRSWDKVDFANAVNGPPYSRPPSAIISGPNDRELLKGVIHVSRARPRPRDRPKSDTALYIPPNSKACIVM